MSSLDLILVPFNTPAITVAGSPTSWGEVGGFVTGALCVWLVARQNAWNWPIGILNNLAFLALFAATGLFADSALQVVYIALSLYGWWAWLRGGAGHGSLAVTRTTPAQWLGLAASGLVMTLGMAWVLRSYTPSTVPWADAVTTTLSLLATWGQTRKKVESWWLWIAADVIYVPLYAYKSLWLTALLYLGFICLCVMGLRSWSASARAERLALA